jgi:hypothetical protein
LDLLLKLLIGFLLIAAAITIAIAWLTGGPTG